METMSVKYETIDQYIANFPPEIQAVLQEVRKTIKKAAPEASEKISYGIPTFFLKGNLVHFGGFKTHIGFYPGPGAIVQFKDELSAYEQSKGAIRLMSKTDAMFYAKDKIRVNSIHPGYINTPNLGEISNKPGMSQAEIRAAFDKLQPLGHVGEAMDIAYGILYLASDESKFVTASELVIDGGIYGGRLFDSM
jgi:uncharacterized protein YdhG (YjbR/CyaY superfamily)